jgi:hypothetical protein
MIWPIWVVQAVWAIAAIVVGEMMRPKPKIENPRPSSLGDFGFPTATEGRVIPVFWGTVKISGPNVTWYGDMRTEAIKKKQKTGMWSSTMVTLGFRYHLGVQHALGFGELDEFVGLILDDKNITMFNTVTTADTITFDMNQPTLFGKAEQEGGVKGRVTIYKGTFTQTPNTYLGLKIGEAIPAYRPVVQAIFEGCYLGNSGRMPKPEFIVRRCPNPLGLTGGKHNIGGDANPANIIYEIMTNRVWGMGIPGSLIDFEVFKAVGNTLADEGLGMSLLVDNEQGGENLMSEIVRHMDGVVYNDYATGKFKIALVRKNYDIATLPVVNEATVQSGTFEFSRASWEDTQNTVKVKYLDRDQNYTERVVQHQDLANISVRGGAIEAEDYDFLAFSNAVIANKVCARVLQTVSSPLSRINFEANRTVTPWIRPGAVFKMEWAELGIQSVVYRVTEVDYGTIGSPAIRVSAIEDIFAVANVAYNTPNPSGWTNPIQPPVALANQKLIEAPYLMVGENRAVLTLAARNGGQELGYNVYADPAGGTSFALIGDEPGFTPTGTLVAGYGASTDTLDATGFLIQGVDGVDYLDTANADQFNSGQNLLIIDNEVMAWTSVVSVGAGQYRVQGVLQGVLDTIPTTHSAGARVWFLTEGFGATSTEPYSSNVTVNVKLTPYSAQGELPLASATAVSQTVSQRAWKPYPAAKLLVDGSKTAVNVTGDATVTWAIRDRLVQIDDKVVVAQAAANVIATPEHTYDVKVYIGGVLKRTANITAAPFDTYTYTPAMRLADDADTTKLVQFGVIAKRGTFTSVERQSQLVFMLDAASPLNVTETSLPDAAPGVAYSFQLHATGGATPYAWTITSGLTAFNAAGFSMSSGGLITGTASIATALSITVQVEGPVGNTDTQVLVLTVSGECSDYTVPAVTGAIFNITETEVVLPATGNTIHVCNLTTTDVLYPSTTSLLHFDGANGSTAMTDQKGIVWTASGAAALSTTQNKFGGASLLPGPLGAAGVGSYVQSAANAAFTFGTGDFTVEYWLYQDPATFSGTTRIHLDQRPLANGAYLTLLQIGGSGVMNVLVNSANKITTAAGTLVASTWQHIAYTRTGGVGRLFVNGVQKGSWADTTDYVGTVNRLGQTSASNAVDNRLSGYIDELRITKGSARYTADFTPPMAPFPNG